MSGISPVFAQTASPSSRNSRIEARQANTQAKVTNLQSKAAAEINNRIADLNKALALINGIKKISDSDKNSLASQVKSEIQTMQTLATKIQGETDTVALRADVQSITKAYRVYMLFIPKIHIFTAGNRINDTVSLMQNVINKLQSRITSGGSSTSSLQIALDDAKAKLSDATTQVTNADSLVTPLQPDNGDMAVAQANKTALTSARNDIKAATDDLKAARTDFQTIVQAIKALKPGSKASPTP